MKPCNTQRFRQFSSSDKRLGTKPPARGALHSNGFIERAQSTVRDFAAQSEGASDFLASQPI
jgi:hypothetical protein